MVEHDLRASEDYKVFKGSIEAHCYSAAYCRFSENPSLVNYMSPLEIQDAHKKFRDQVGEVPSKLFALYASKTFVKVMNSDGFLDLKLDSDSLSQSEEEWVKKNLADFLDD